jgi:hypothetical protein
MPAQIHATAMPCPICGATATDACAAAGLSAIDEALAADDVDAAIRLGLLDRELPPPDATACADCLARLARIRAARAARVTALAARERFRAREARVTKRAEARARQRAGAAAGPAIAESRGAVASALPTAAAAALARAKARAAKSRPDGA